MNQLWGSGWGWGWNQGLEADSSLRKNQVPLLVPSFHLQQPPPPPFSLLSSSLGVEKTQVFHSGDPS